MNPLYLQQTKEGINEALAIISENYVCRDKVAGMLKCWYSLRATTTVRSTAKGLGLATGRRKD